MTGVHDMLVHTIEYSYLISVVLISCKVSHQITEVVSVLNTIPKLGMGSSQQVRLSIRLITSLSLYLKGPPCGQRILKS